MSIDFRRGLLLAGAPILIAQPAGAAESPTDGAEPAAILVTATKKAGGEDPQTIPIAVNLFDGPALDALKLRDLQSLTHAVPGVSLDPVGTFRGVANWSIRGLGINSSIASIDPSVGTIVDGVYLGINPGAAFDLFDVASVEVLRGPQGTLFGRNVTGGAVLVNTADPSDHWQMVAKIAGDGPVDAGRGGMTMRGQATLSGPIIEGAAFRLGAYHSSDGGYFRNGFNGGHLGKAETTILRSGLSFGSADRLRVVAKAEYLDTRGDGATGQNHGLFARDSFDVSLDNEGRIAARSGFLTLRADQALDTGVVTNIFGWRQYRQTTDNDIDSTPDFLFHSATGLAQEQWSNELRYAGTVGRLDVTLGGYIFHQSVAYEEDRKIPPNPLFYGGGRQMHDVRGLFLSGSYDLSPTVTLDAGLRYSHEKKRADVTFVRPRPACSVVAKTCPTTGTNPSVPGEANGFTDRRSVDNWSPRIALSYRAGPATLAYASWSRAYRAGGYNLRITQPAAFLQVAAAGTPAFGDERVDSFEIGLKHQSADGRATINLAAYRSDVDDMQREISLSSASSGLAQSVYNTADARIWGAEAEARLALASRLALTLNLGYIDAGYRRVFFDISGDNQVDGTDLALALPRVPKWTWGGGVTHELPLGGPAALVTRIAFQHRGRYAYTDNNFGWVNASDTLDADLTWRLPVEGFSISVYGRNLLDAVQFGGDTQIPFGGPLSDGDNRPFDPYPAAGTFSPLVKGRLLGVEVTVAL